MTAVPSIAKAAMTCKLPLLRHQLLLLLTGLFLTASAQTSDLQGRWGVKCNANLPKRFAASLGYQLRTYENMSVFYGSYFSGSVEYTLLKNLLTTEATYRFRTTPFNNQHRFNWGVTARTKLNKFDFSLRSQLQRGYPYFNEGDYEPGNAPVNYWRNRVQVQYKIYKHTNAFVSAEMFLRFSEQGMVLKRMRYIGGVEWAFKKRQQVSLYYLWQLPYASSNPKTVYALGLDYSYDLPKIGKMKKKKKQKGTADLYQ